MLQQLGEILGEDPPEEVNEKLRVILRTEAPPELATLDMDAIDTGVRAVQAVVALNAEVQRIKNTATFTAAQADEAERKLRLRDEDEAIIALLL